MRQYQNLPISTSTSTSTAQILTVPVPVPVLRILSENAAKFQFFERRISFHAGNSNYVEQFWTFWVWNFNLKRKIWQVLENSAAANFFLDFFAFFFVLVLILIDSVLAWSVPVQSEYLKTGPVPVPVHQYQKWSVDWKNQYQYQWTDSSIVIISENRPGPGPVVSLRAEPALNITGFDLDSTDF